QTAYAITNHGSTSSLLTHYKLAKKAGLKFVFGVEAYITKDITIKEKFDYQHICLWAKNFTGYKNILKLTTVAYDKGFYYKPRIDWNTLMNYKEGLIVGSACLGGILGIKDDKGGFDRQKIYETAKKYHDEFGEDFYIELHTNQMPEQLEFNRLLVDISRLLDIRTIATCDAHYVYKKDAKIHKMWLGIDDENEENSYYQTDDFYLHSEEEMREALKYLPAKIVNESIGNTDVLTDKCNVEIKFGENNFPIFKCDNQVETVKAICRKGWIQKINTKIPKSEQKKYLDRFLEEMDILAKADYLNMMLIVWDYMKWGQDNGIRFGCGRGSVGASLVAYLMDITKVDPIENDLTFSRFCNLERVTTADELQRPLLWKHSNDKIVNTIAQWCAARC
ncbi:MAG: PHP domain-containing protein, partial [Lachnospiraceae bacterium]|nr:PHP domain-containing protein [Lachnospiraceae bacterium]